MSNRRNTYTPNMDAPTGRRRGGRGIVAFVFTLLLPPVGIAMLWRGGIFRMRGRMLLTGIATVEMAILFSFLIPNAAVVQDMPVASIPAAVTVAPDDGTTSALTNLEQVLMEQQNAEGVTSGEETEADASDPEAAARLQAEQEAILDTVVYAVYNDAKLYHKSSVCGTQSNRRELTVREALLEGLGACSKCNPPVYTGY